MRLTAKVEVNIRTAEAQARGAGWGRAFAAQMGGITREIARENVALGRGPGPHPHVTPHEDTGELMEAVKVEEREQGFLKTALVYTDSMVGFWLEMGWHAHGNHAFYRYPWLEPALTEARQQAADVGRATGRMFFSESGGFLRGRQNIGSLPSAALMNAVDDIVAAIKAGYNFAL